MLHIPCGKFVIPITIRDLNKGRTRVFSPLPVWEKAHFRVC